MNSSLSIPTENIYKFYAIFGLALIISSIIGAAVVVKDSNSDVISYYEKIHSLEKKDSSKDNKELVTKYKELIDVTVVDKKLFVDTLITLFFAAIFISGFGFFRWHKKYQPMQNELLELQIEKLKKENSE